MHTERKVWKYLRIGGGLTLVVWGLVGILAYFLPFFLGLSAFEWWAISIFIIALPGGWWCVLLGLAILGRDVPLVMRFNQRLKAKIKNKFPRLYEVFAAQSQKCEAAAKKKLQLFLGWLKRLFSSHLVIVPFTVLILVLAANASEQKPLILDFVADPAILQRTGNNATVVEIVQDIVGRASLIFNAEIGCRLVVGRIEVAAPPIKDRSQTVVPGVSF